MGAAVDVDDALLTRWPLPRPDSDGDKEQRGRVLVVAGSPEVPGAAWLAGTAALRSGCGKLLLACGASIAGALAVAVPESRVVALPEDDDGALADAAAERLQPWADRLAAVLVGPGLADGDRTVSLVVRLLEVFGAVPVVLDAAAMEAVRALPQRDAPVLVTPHAGEMAQLTGLAKEQVRRDPAAAALGAARRWGAGVALKGPQTVVATPAGALWRHDGRGLVGLATSGSGDVLAGLVAGLAARGAPLEQAAVWGVALHARAGAALAQRMGSLGYLARELAAEVPRLMDRS